MSVDWYVLRVASGQEDRVRRSLESRVKAKGLEESVPRILVPTETVTEIKNGRKRTMRKKIYPGYVIVEMELDTDTRFLIRETPGVGDFIGTHGKPERASIVAQIISPTESASLDYPFRLMRRTIGFTAGNSSRTMAATMIGPAKGRLKKMEKDPLLISRDCRRAGSARGPSTIASTAGARG